VKPLGRASIESVIDLSASQFTPHAKASIPGDDTIDYGWYYDETSKVAGVSRLSIHQKDDDVVL